MKFTIYIFLILALVSCETKDPIPKELSEYLTETLNLLEKNSVNKKEIDWEEFKMDVYKYGSKIIPDFEVDENQALNVAIEWIYQMNKTMFTALPIENAKVIYL